MKRNFLRDTQPANHPSSLPPPWVTRFGELFSRTRPRPPPTCTVRECVRLEIRSNRKTPGRKRSSIWPAEGEAWKSSFDSFDSDSPPPRHHLLPNLSPTSLPLAYGRGQGATTTIGPTASLSPPLPPPPDELGLKDGKRLQRKEVGFGFHPQALYLGPGQSRKILPSLEDSTFCSKVVVQRRAKQVGWRILRICGF